MFEKFFSQPESEQPKETRKERRLVANLEATRKRIEAQDELQRTAEKLQDAKAAFLRSREDLRQTELAAKNPDAYPDSEIAKMRADKQRKLDELQAEGERLDEVLRQKGINPDDLFS